VTGSSEGVKSVFSNGCLTAVDIANAIDQVDCERADARASRTGLMRPFQRIAAVNIEL
jgi:hypothetical protein